MRAFELVEGKNTPVIVVDVQPAYENTGYGESNFGIFRNIARLLNNQTGPILMFVNAEQDGLTEDSLASIKDYWEEKLGFDSWNRVTLVDKGYGYLRPWMDQGISAKTMVRVIRYLYQHKENDIRNLDEQVIQELAGDEYESWMLDENFSVEWTSISQLKKFNRSYIVGGGRNECLRELELLMNAFNIRYKEIDSLIYG